MYNQFKCPVHIISIKFNHSASSMTFANCQLVQLFEITNSLGTGFSSSYLPFSLYTIIIVFIAVKPSLWLAYRLVQPYQDTFFSFGDGENGLCRVGGPCGPPPAAIFPFPTFVIGLVFSPDFGLPSSPDLAELFANSLLILPGEFIRILSGDNKGDATDSGFLFMRTWDWRCGGKLICGFDCKRLRCGCVCWWCGWGWWLGCEANGWWWWWGWPGIWGCGRSTVGWIGKCVKPIGGEWLLLLFPPSIGPLLLLLVVLVGLVACMGGEFSPKR